MDFVIRLACLEDAPALADLLREIGYFATVNAETPAATRERVSRHLALNLADDSHTVYACLSADKALLGYLSVHWLPYLIHSGPEGYISELFVRDSARGQGVGSALLAAAVTEARRRGCGRMALVNMRFRDSYLRGFYTKHGWQEREDAANFILTL